MTATQAKAARTAADNAEKAKAAVASAVLPADATAAADDAEYEANAAISAAREAEGAADEAEAASSTAGAAKATAEGAAAEAKATFETENMPAGKAWALGFVARQLWKKQKAAAVESGAFQPGGVSLIKKRDPKAVVRTLALGARHFTLA